MAKVTDLKPQKKRLDRYNLYLDGSYVFAVSANTVLAAGLHVGMEVNEAQLQKIQRRAEVGNAHDRALNYINLRRRSTREIWDYLKRKDYESPVIYEVVERLQKVDLLNDEEFARAWVRDRLLLKPRSKQALRVELIKKGIEHSIIDRVLGDMEAGSEQRALEQAVRRRLRQKKYQGGNDREKLIAALAREGYRYNDIKNCLQQTDDT